MWRRDIRSTPSAPVATSETKTRERARGGAGGTSGGQAAPAQVAARSHALGLPSRLPPLRPTDGGGDVTHMPEDARQPGRLGLATKKRPKSNLVKINRRPF